ncbi:MAG: tyrosine--tRNA ligase, partial [Planctomycetaceae bacterium]
MSFPPVEEQLAVIRRGVEKIVPEEELIDKLKRSRETGTPLRVKYGIDPTGIDLHLGHTVPMRKMRQFQQLGHQAVIIIGNYTAMVGDPSGRDEARKARLTQEQVEANARDYLAQVGKVIDLSNAEVHRNGDWFSRMNFADILQLTSKVTVAQLLTRDDFSKRYKEEKPIYLHECLYPVMQGWDSVEIKADVELGGTEQLYSFMLARDLQRDQGLPQQVGVMSPILVGLDGVRRMGKSLGNYIGISEPPYEMIKKFMQVPDDCMRMFFELLTDLPMDEVNAILAGHPKEAKIKLAQTIITEYHDAPSADEAADRWQREIGENALPDEIPVARISRSELTDGRIPAAPLLRLAGLCDTGGEARRKIQEGGAYVGEEKTRIERHDQPI